MNKIVLAFSVIVFLVACKQDKAMKEFNYSEEKLHDVIKDLYIASEALERMKPEFRDSVGKEYRTEIAEYHDVNMNLFEEDMKALIDDPERYTKIHKTVRDSLIAMEKKINKMKYGLTA